jgi:hypothetical protein
MALGLLREQPKRSLARNLGKRQRQKADQKQEKANSCKGMPE